jgi:hypothetical protein
MGRQVAALFLLSGILATWSFDAQAQKIPWIVLPLAASPIIALFLAIAVGFARKSWLAGLGNTALVVLWLAWFVAASRHSTSDLLTWVPMVALGLHTLAMTGWILAHVIQRIRERKAARPGAQV